MKIGRTEIQVVQGDITEIKADAIVNAANNRLVMGGGVAGAIKKKGGVGIEAEAVKAGPIAIGASVATGAGALPVRYVIHAATMGMDFATDEAKVRAACRSALAKAEELKISSIVLPALGCGVGGFPLLASAKIMAQEVYRYLRAKEVTLREITFCLLDKKAVEAFREGVTGYLTHVTQELEKGPFVTVDAIIEMPSGGGGDEQEIIVIERSNPPFGFALPGGFVEYGESLEEAVKREAQEETGMALRGLRQFHTYSDAGRDPRFHTIATVFIAQGEGSPSAGDDAQGLKVVTLKEAAGMAFAFDHKTIIEEYALSKKGKSSL